MIKLFRNIRQNLLNEGKTSKYFKYAIGEIVLVVIGILIALQINNWNEERIDNNIEFNLLKSCKEGLEKDLADANHNVKRHKRGIEDCNYLIELLESPNPIDIDTFSQKMANVMIPTFFIHSTSAFEAIKSKGVNIISNEDLRNQIIDVYDSQYTFYLKNEASNFSDFEFIVREVFPSRFEQAYFYRLDQKGLPGEYRPIDVEALKHDQEFLYFLKTLRNKLNIMVHFQYSKLTTAITNLIESLDTEIHLKEEHD